MSFNRKRRLKNSNPFKVEYGTGSVVRALAGRTRGKFFVITDIFTDVHGKSFALIADGVKYTAGNPKKKNITQLEFVTKSDAKTDDEIIKLLSNQ